MSKIENIFLWIYLGITALSILSIIWLGIKLCQHPEFIWREHEQEKNHND